MSDDGFLPGVIFTAIISFVILFWIKQAIDDSWRHQAENHGCAEFYLDSNRERQWRWK